VARKGRSRAPLWLGLLVALAAAHGLLGDSSPWPPREATAHADAERQASSSEEAPAKPAANTKPKKKRVSAQELIAPQSPFHSAEACERFVSERIVSAKKKSKPRGTLRVGTWNLAWFPDGTANGADPERARDVPWMACVIASLDVQVLAVQEVVQHPRGRAALLDLEARLDTLTSGRWKHVLDDCKDDGRQHLGFLYDSSRVTLEGTQMVSRINPGRNACDMRLRPGYAIGVRLGNTHARLLNVHFDSGQLARDADHRVTSFDRLLEELPELPGKRTAPVIALGDFNTMGCDGCEPKRSAQGELAQLEARASQALPKLSRIADEHACSEYYRGHGSLLDLVFVGNLGQGKAKLETHGICSELRCAKLGRSQSPPALTRLSDHCPLVLELNP
jgi:endonuclease/exonuclease/phosphatase family metal-dependent hydrolase